MTTADRLARPSSLERTSVPPSPDRSPLDRLLAWRDRLLASAAFQRRAARFLPTRWIARRRAGALFDLVAGFTYSQVLLACVRLRLFDFLLERPRTPSEIAGHADLDVDAVDRLMTAAVALRLVETRRGGRYGLGPLGAPMAGNRAIASMVEHHGALYADLADPVALLRGQRPATSLGSVWGYAANDAADALDDGRVAAYSTLMTQSQPLVADQILDTVSLADRRALLDVGGGEGCFAIEAAKRHPQLRVTVFDLPAVAARAHRAFEAAGLADRAATCGGDFARDALPTGADVVTLVRVIHDHDDDRAMRILERARAALPVGGLLVLAEPMADTPGAEAMGGAYFGMYLLAMGSGRPRSPQRLMAMLREVGFERPRLVATSMPLQTRVIEAIR